VILDFENSQMSFSRRLCPFRVFASFQKNISFLRVNPPVMPSCIRRRVGTESWHLLRIDRSVPPSLRKGIHQIFKSDPLWCYPSQGRPNLILLARPVYSRPSVLGIPFCRETFPAYPHRLLRDPNHSFTSPAPTRICSFLEKAELGP
jgi:hypothetical protein